MKKPILSVGKFCSRAPQRSAWYDAQGGVLRHELAGLVQVKRIANHYALECWAIQRNRDQHAGAMLAPIVDTAPGEQVLKSAASSGSVLPAEPMLESVAP